MMDWIYIGISWILLRWHALWDLVLPGGAQFLGTNWDWILAIVFLVITVRILLFPIFVKQIRSQRAMQALQPKVKELQAKHKGDQETFRQEMMKLYQTEKVNPLMGCLPMFLQIPVFLGLFHVLQRLDPVQTLNTTIYGWTQGEWDGAAVARIFGAPIAARFADGGAQLDVLNANGTTVKLVAGVLVLIMMTTTFLTSRQMILKTGWSADPQQRMIQKLMLYGIPISLLLSGWYFPIGVIVYWVTQNLFSLGQQHWVLHKYPPPAMEGATPVGAKKGAPAEGPRSVLQRILSPTPRSAAVNGAGATANGVVSPGRRSGLFRRKAATVPAIPATSQPEGRSLAPKPGAKPMHVRGHGASAGHGGSAGNGASAGHGGAEAPSGGSGRGADRQGTPALVDSPAAAETEKAESARVDSQKQEAGQKPEAKKPEPAPKQSGPRASNSKRNSGSARKRTGNKKGSSRR